MGRRKPEITWRMRSDSQQTLSSLKKKKKNKKQKKKTNKQKNKKKKTVAGTTWLIETGKHFKEKNT